MRDKYKDETRPASLLKAILIALSMSVLAFLLSTFLGSASLLYRIIVSILCLICVTLYIYLRSNSKKRFCNIIIDGQNITCQAFYSGQQSLAGGFSRITIRKTFLPQDIQSIERSHNNVYIGIAKNPSGVRTLLLSSLGNAAETEDFLRKTANLTGSSIPEK